MKNICLFELLPGCCCPEGTPLWVDRAEKLGIEIGKRFQQVNDYLDFGVDLHVRELFTMSVGLLEAAVAKIGTNAIAQENLCLFVKSLMIPTNTTHPK
jgi:hypothetical protein